MAPPSLSASSNSPAGQDSLGDTLRLTTTGQNLIDESTPDATYQWNGPHGYTSTVANPIIPNSTTAHSGTYTVTVTTPGGCTATAQTSVSLTTACRMSFDGDPVTTCDSLAADSTHQGAIIVKLLNIPDGSTLHITLYQQTTVVATASSSPASFTGLTDGSYRVEAYAVTGTDTCRAGSRNVTVDCDSRELNIRIKSVDATPNETDLIPRVGGGLGTLTLSVEELDGQDLSGYTYLWTEPTNTSATTSTATTTTLTGRRIGEYKVTLVKGADTLVAYTTLRAKPCKQVAHTYQCGRPATPVGSLDDTGISNLAPGDTIRTGDFDVIVTEIISGGSGGWTGRGYTQIPYLGDTQIAVDFTNATVNDCYEYTGGGTVQSAFDASWGSVVDIDTLIGDFKDLLRNSMANARYLANNFDDSQSHKNQAKELSDQLVSLRQQINSSNLSASDKQEALSALDQLEAGLTGLANGSCSSSGARLSAPLPSARVASTGSCATDITTASDRLANLGLDIGAGLGAAISPEVAAAQLAKFKLLDWSKSVVDATGVLDGSAIQLSAEDLASYIELVDNINLASADKIQIVLLDSGFDETNLEDVLKKGELASLIPSIFDNVKRIFIKIDQTRKVISGNLSILTGCHAKARDAVQNEDNWDFKLIGYATKFIKCITDENIANYFSNGNSEALFSAGVVNAVAEDLDVVEVKQAFNNATSQASKWAKDIWTSISQGKVKKEAIEKFAKPLLSTSWDILQYLVLHASNDLDNATNRFKTSPYFRGRVMGKLVMFFAPFANTTTPIRGSTSTLEDLKVMLQRKSFTLKPSSSNGVIIIEDGNTSITIRQADDLLTATSTTSGSGVYTTKIDWGIHTGVNGVPARPFGEGYWGRRFPQNKPRVDALELKINPNNESYYIKNSQGSFVQFEGFDGVYLKDGKCVGCNGTSSSSPYLIEENKWAEGTIVSEARRQIDVANLYNLKVEWLVTDGNAADQLRRFFAKTNINIKVTYFPE